MKRKILSAMLLCVSITFVGCSTDDYDEQSMDNGSILTRSNDIIIDDSICGTVEKTPPAWFFNNARAVSLYKEGYDLNEYQVNVYVHVIRDSEGTTPSGYERHQALYNTVATLNKFYEETGITFYPRSIDYIDSTTFINATINNIDMVFNSKRKNTGLNVYLMSQAPYLNGLLGMASDIISNAVVLAPYHHLDRIVAHEVGHCYGLYHTHHGTYPGENGIPEFVDGSNGSTAGDYITDTPADPCSWNKATHTYVGNLTDAHGDYYNPDPLNLMSYSGNEQVFTQKQVDRMKATLNKEMVAAMTANVTKHEIEGPDSLDVTAGYSVYCPAGYSVKWKVTTTTYRRNMGKTVNTNTYDTKEISLVANYNIDVPQQTFDISVTLTSPNKKFVRKAQKRVFHLYKE